MRQMFNGFSFPRGFVFIVNIVLNGFQEFVELPVLDGGLEYPHSIHSVKGFLIAFDICLDPPIVVPYVNKSLFDFIRRDRIAILVMGLTYG